MQAKPNTNHASAKAMRSGCRVRFAGDPDNTRGWKKENSLGREERIPPIFLGRTGCFDLHSSLDASIRAQ
jgi:hypothetical protein